jgi:hypothetical protein
VAKTIACDAPAAATVVTGVFAVDVPDCWKTLEEIAANICPPVVLFGSGIAASNDVLFPIDVSGIKELRGISAMVFSFIQR